MDDAFCWRHGQHCIETYENQTKVIHGRVLQKLPGKKNCIINFWPQAQWNKIKRSFTENIFLQLFSEKKFSRKNVLAKIRELQKLTKIFFNFLTPTSTYLYAWESVEWKRQRCSLVLLHFVRQLRTYVGTELPLKCFCGHSIYVYDAHAIMLATTDARFALVRSIPVFVE